MIPIRLDIFAGIILLGMAQGVFLSAFFLSKKKVEHVLLGCLLLAMAAFSADIFLGYSGYMTRVLHLVDSTEPLNFVIGPLIFLYITVLTNRQEKLRPIQYLHFLPALLYAGYLLFFLLQTQDYKYNAYIDAYYPDLPRLDAPARWHEDPLFIRRNLSSLQFLHTGIYLVVALGMYNQWRKDKGALPQNKALSKWMFVMLAGFLAGMVATSGIKVVFERDLGEYLIASVLMVLIYSISFFVVKQSAFLNTGFSDERASGDVSVAREAKPETGAGKYKKSAFPRERAQEYEQVLIRVMENGKPYLDPNFSMADLVDKTRLSRHVLSELLNSHLGKTFYEFIADYRVEEAKKLLAADIKRLKSIQQIAEEVGYYSKSSFNTAFKKITGLTPSQFRKTVL